MDSHIKNIVLYDQDIREPLFDYLEERFGKSRIFEEKTIGKSRADILLLTQEQVIGLEIKSDMDTYERLKRQVLDYNTYCDRNYAVIGRTHEKNIEEHIPEFWGVLSVRVEDGKMVIEEKRAAQDNPKMKKEMQFTLLWRAELQHLLEYNRLPKYRQKSKKFIRQKLLEKMDWETLKKQMCEELFERDYTLLNNEEE